MPNVFLDGLQRPAILPNNSGLPDYSEANDGDALIIEDGEPTWGAVDALPEIEETDEGKVLAVDQGEAVWADAPSGLPEIGENDEGKVLTVVDNSGTLEAEWAEPSGGTLPDLSGLEVPLGTAVMGAISAIPSGGLMGKYAGLQGSTITAEQAEVVANAINAGRFTALDMNVSVVTGAITTPSSEHLHIPLGSLAFMVPYYSDYIIGASIVTAESSTGDTYLPAVFVSAWAIKIGNYPSN